MPRKLKRVQRCYGAIYSLRLRQRRLAFLSAKTRLTISEEMQLDELKRQQKWGRDYASQPRLLNHLQAMFNTTTTRYEIKIVDWDEDREGYLIWKGNIATAEDDQDDPFDNPPCTNEEAVTMLEKVIDNALQSPWHLKYPLYKVSIRDAFAFCCGK